jgi:hypothetical protein
MAAEASPSEVTARESTASEVAAASEVTAAHVSAATAAAAAVGRSGDRRRDWRQAYHERRCRRRGCFAEIEHRDLL